MSRATAFITGAGPGTGAAIARLFGESYNSILMSRSSPGSLPSSKLDNVPESNILPVTYDGTPECYKKAVADAAKKWPGSELKVGICNNGGPWIPGPFLEKTSEEFETTYEFARQGFDFSQAVIPAMLKAGGGTLIFTGSISALRGSKGFAAMSPGAFSRRSSSQCLAREFQPQGIHVAHVVVDGQINTERVEKMMGKVGPDERLDPNDIAATYMDLVKQRPSAWSQEIDIRPAKEKF